MQNESNDNNQRGKKINWIKGILYFLILPFILMFFYAKFVLKAIREKNKVNMALSAAVFVLIVFSIVINPGTTSSSQENSANYSKDKVALSDNKIVENQTTEVVKEVTTENATEELKVVYNNLKDLESDELILNFIDACTSANIDVNNIRSLEKIDDWTAGKRYKFVYLGKEIILYTNMDFSISSIRTNGLRVFLYK